MLKTEESVFPFRGASYCINDDVSPRDPSHAIYILSSPPFDQPFPFLSPLFTITRHTTSRHTTPFNTIPAKHIHTNISTHCHFQFLFILNLGFEELPYYITFFVFPTA
eukprot:821080_1